jgi:hypothetical protein
MAREQDSPRYVASVAALERWRIILHLWRTIALWLSSPDSPQVHHGIFDCRTAVGIADTTPAATLAAKAAAARATTKAAAPAATAATIAGAGVPCSLQGNEGNMEFQNI